MRVFADVKSKSKSVKFVDVVLRRGDEEEEGEGGGVEWWEEFPKRWVIVILCFSAFLLCNMDRVSL